MPNKIPNPKTELPYWDEGNRNKYEWFKKGWWKRQLRKKFLKKFFKNVDKE